MVEAAQLERVLGAPLVLVLRALLLLLGVRPLVRHARKRRLRQRLGRLLAVPLLRPVAPHLVVTPTVQEPVVLDPPVLPLLHPDVVRPQRPDRLRVVLPAVLAELAEAPKPLKKVPPKRDPPAPPRPQS